MVISLCYSVTFLDVFFFFLSFQNDLIFSYAKLSQCIIDEFRNQNWDFTMIQIPYFVLKLCSHDFVLTFAEVISTK